MSDALVQALRLTVLGMGMTFTSIAALALGMWGMTVLTRVTSPDASTEGGKENVEPVASDVAGDPIDGIGETSDLVEAVAAATAVALALADQAEVRDADAVKAAAVAVAVSQAMQSPDVASGHQAPSEAWDAFVRGGNLARRARYDARKPR